MVEISVQPLVGVLCLIVFHIQAVMDPPDHCAWQLGSQVVSSQNSSQQKVLQSPWYTHFHVTYTISIVFHATYTITTYTISIHLHATFILSL